MNGLSVAVDDNVFQQKLLDTLNGGFTSASLILGYQLGLFDHVTPVPQSASQIAESAGYKQRYVEEWLKCMAISGFIHVNDDGSKFWMDQNWKGLLSNQNPLMLISVGLPTFCGAAYYQVMECFKKDGPKGLPYTCYPHFTKYMTGLSDTYQLGKRLISGYLSMVPNVIEQLRNGGRYLDLACGAGSPSYTVAKTFPECQSFGIDYLDVQINVAKSRAQKENLPNLHYMLHDAANLPSEWSNTFDYITIFDGMHDMHYPDKTLQEVFRVLKPGRHLSIIDINVSKDIHANKSRTILCNLLYNLSLFHSVPIDLNAKNGLGAGLGLVPGIEVFSAMAKKAGFVQIKEEPMPDFAYLNVHLIFQKPL